MAAATASMNNVNGTFMFHPRTAVFEQPITYHIPPSKSTSSAAPKPDQPDFSQYYISELFRSYFPRPFCSRDHCSLDFLCLALESRTTILKSAKGPISVAECDTQGRFIIIENTSRSKSIALAGWTLRQQSDQGDLLTFTFPENCLLRPNHSLKVNFELTLIGIYAFVQRSSPRPMNPNEETPIWLLHRCPRGIQAPTSSQL